MSTGQIDWTVMLVNLVPPVGISLALLWLLWRITR
jgi:hypothetical protein